MPSDNDEHDGSIFFFLLVRHPRRIIGSYHRPSPGTVTVTGEERREQRYYYIGLGLDRLLYVSSRSYSRNILTVGSVFITAASDNTIINIRLQTLLLLN